MTLRKSLLLLTLAVLLPALLFMATMTVLLVREERAAIRTGLTQTASALSEAVDARVVDALSSLRVLAANVELQSQDLAQFGSEAVRVVASQPGWDHVFLADMSGQQVLNTSQPDGSALPSVADLPLFLSVMETRDAYAGGALFEDPVTGRLCVAVALPIRGAGRIDYVLAAVLDPMALSTAFASQELGNGWVATVLDNQHRIIARSISAEELLGQMASPERVAQVTTADAGMFEGLSREGVQSIGAYQRSDLTGWTLMLAAPETMFFASVSRSILLILGGGALLVTIGAVLSARMGQRIERLTRSLVVPARRLASGETLLPRPKAGLQEIELIGQEMDRAAALLEDRAKQQDAISSLSLRAVTAADRSELFDEVLRVVTGILRVEFCDVLEHLPDEDAFVLRAGIGWKPGMVGAVRVPNQPENLAGYGWAKGELVVYRDLINETRFTRTDLLQELGAVSGMAVLIFGPHKPFGMLGVHSATYREFTESELDFVKAVANVVSAFLSRTDVERQLAESERRLRHFVSSMNAVPYRYDVEAGRYTFVGPQSMRLLGFTPEEWGTVGWWARQMHPDDRSGAIEREALLTERGEDYVLEYRMVTNDGRTVWIRDVVRVEIAENGNKMLYGMAIDITEAKEREQQLLAAQKLQAVGQLTGGIAHDFNNLLAIIIGTCELLTEQADGNSTLQKTVGQIATAADRGAALTQRLLAFSRKQALRPDVVDLNDLVRSMEPLLERTLGETVGIRAQLADDLGATLVDLGQLENVLVNLALNARDAMPDGGDVVIETRNVSFNAQDGAWEQELPPGYYVMLAVSDTGVGMTPAVRARAFEPFFTTKSAGRGSGLGLSTVYGFIKQSGGNITIYSEPGHGTTVRVYLPRVEPSEVDAPVAVVTESPGRSETVLVVEDDSAVRRVVAGMVESLGYQVLEAESGTDAIALLEAGESVDLVLSDVVMPGHIDGWKLAQSVWERWPTTRVLLTTGYSDNVLVRHATLDARTQVISKPYRRSELSVKIRAVLDA